ncbi:hypothetical protein BN440_2194 [Erwinia amylovora MR1]|nr:hypothetical protein BN440_2194 [Erwinia amylovora MR1]
MPGNILPANHSYHFANPSPPDASAAHQADIWFDALEYQAIELENAPVVPLREDFRRCISQLIAITADIKQRELLSALLAKLLPGLPVGLLIAADSLYTAIVERRQTDIGVLNALGLASVCLPDKINLLPRLAAYVREIIIRNTDASLLWLLPGEEEGGLQGDLCTALALMAVAARYWIAGDSAPQRDLLRVPAFMAGFFVRISYYWAALGNIARSGFNAQQAVQQQPAFVMDSYVETTWKGCVDIGHDARLCPAACAVISHFSANSTLFPASLTTATAENSRPLRSSWPDESLADRAISLAALNLMRENKLTTLINCVNAKAETHQAWDNRRITRTYLRMQCDAVANRAANVHTSRTVAISAKPDFQLTAGERKVNRLQGMATLAAATLLTSQLHAKGGVATTLVAMAGMASATTSAHGVTTRVNVQPSDDVIGDPVHRLNSAGEFKRIADNTISHLEKTYHPVLDPLEYINSIILIAIRQYEENIGALSGLTPQSKVRVTFRLRDVANKNISTPVSSNEIKLFTIAEIVTGLYHYETRHLSGMGYEVDLEEYGQLFRLIDDNRLADKMSQALSDYKNDTSRIAKLKKYYQKMVVLRAVQFLQRHPELPDATKAVEEFLAGQRLADGLTFHGVNLNGVFAIPCCDGVRTILFSVDKPETFILDLGTATRQRVPITPDTKAFRDFVREKMPFYAAIKYAGDIAFHITNRRTVILNGRMQPVTVSESDFSFTQSSGINALGDRLFDHHIERINSDINSLFFIDEAQRNEKWCQAARTFLNPVSQGPGSIAKALTVPSSIGEALSLLNNRLLPSEMADSSIAEKAGDRVDGIAAHFKDALCVMALISDDSGIADKGNNRLMAKGSDTRLKLYRHITRLADKELAAFLLNRLPVKASCSAYLNAEPVNKLPYQVCFGKKIIDIEGRSHELFYNSNLKQFEVDWFNEKEIYQRLPVYMEKLSYRWHPAVDGGAPLFPDPMNEFIKELAISCDHTRYKFSEVNNLNAEYYGDGKIVEVRAVGATPYSNSLFSVVELHGLLVPVKFEVIKGHGVKYDVQNAVSGISWPLIWDGKRWIFEGPTSDLISAGLAEKLTADLYSDLKSSQLSTPDKMGIQYSNDGRKFLKFENSYIEIVPGQSDLHYTINGNIKISVRNGKYRLC